MKQSYTKILSLIVCLLCGISAIAHDFESGGIYYNITDATAKTVEVTSGVKKYTGNVTIPSAVSYNGSDYSVTSIGEKAFYFNDWKYLGKGKINDAFFFSNYYEVEIQQNNVNPNQFRLVKPYHEAFEVDDDGYFGGPWENTDEYLYFNILQPGDTALNGVPITMNDLIYFEPFMTGFEHPTYEVAMELIHPAHFSSLAAESNFTYNKVLSYQENGLPAVVQIAPMYYMDGVGGFNYTQNDGAVTILFPGVVKKDYSVGIEYSGPYTDESNNVYAEFNVSMGNDVKEVKVGMAITDDANEVYSKMLDGTIESVTLTFSGVAHLALDAPGKYTAVAISYDASGNIKETAYTKFNYTTYTTTTKWKSLGMGQYTEGFVCSLFDVQPVSYVVEVQESEDKPGLYRMVNPYGAAYPYNQDGDWDTTQDYFLVINATDPNGVYIEAQKLGLDWGYGMMSASSMAANYLANGSSLEDIKNAGYCGKLQDGVITFPTQGLLITMASEDGWYYANVSYDENYEPIPGSGSFKLVLPSAASKSSISVKAFDNKSVVADKGSITLHKNAQKLCEIKTTSKIHNSNKPLDITNNRIISTDNSKIALNSNRKTTLSNVASETASELISVTIPNSVTKIGNYAFDNCTGLKEVIIEDGTETLSMGEGLFFDCPLEKLYLGRDLSYSNLPFDGITTLQEVTISNSVTKIGYYAFYGCSGLTEIFIPNSVTSIDVGAFYNCSGLTSVTIPNSVTEIGSSAFECCTGLESIVVESGNSVYDSRNNCNAIIETATNTLIIGYKNSTIPNSVTSIGFAAFRACTGLTSITIPNSVTSIDTNAFAGCDSLTEVNIFDLSAWCKINFSDSFANPLNNVRAKLKLNGNEIKDLVIPNDITEIKPCAFTGCVGLSSVTIPNSVTVIGGSAFMDCTRLTSVTIPNSVTSIDVGAFYNCSGLTSVTIPNSVTVIGRAAFYHCNGLTSVTIPNSVTSIGVLAFAYCSLNSIKSLNTTPPTCGQSAFDGSYDAVLEVPADTKEAYSTAAEWCNFTNIIEIATVEVSTQENNATFEIPTTQGAVTYTVNVYSDEAMTQLVATTNYDATGKIIPMATSLELSIDGFEDGTYYYDVVAKSESGETLSNYTGTFEIDAAGICQVEINSNAVEVSRYDINGRLLSEPTKGINIVKYNDGTTKREIIK